MKTIVIRSTSGAFRRLHHADVLSVWRANCEHVTLSTGWPCAPFTHERR